MCADKNFELMYPDKVNMVFETWPQLTLKVPYGTVSSQAGYSHSCMHIMYFSHTTQHMTVNIDCLYCAAFGNVCAVVTSQ